MNSKTERKVAVITGGSSGIGLSLAAAFRDAGYQVVITSRNRERLDHAIKKLASGAGKLEAVVCDVRDPAAVDNLFTELRTRYRRIDVLINNAGVAHALSPVEKLDSETWNEVIATNLTGTFLVTRAALPMMESGSTIVNNLSIAAVEIFEGMSAYNASKAGAMAFTRVLRQELRQKGIRVLALMPGAVDTDIWQQFWADAPRGKMISPESVAQAVLHAVSAPANTTIEEIRIGPSVGVL
jgi:NAD(P)-dependent dehydrogenase (short-subunit alcohol dehydrogenase family)